MAYTPKVWKDGDVITKEGLNNIEEGIANVPAGPKGDKGDTGAAGLSVKSLALTTTDGKVTAGTVTLSDDSTAPVTVTEA
ncbi:hypothetical protein [Lactococcus cremoris]|uniref:Uncharacterized protein n=1 Tax=Lactococcus lactis subsp. cremoris TaxID=1359 RepID=A0AAX4AKS6_LACLC|nr:hypothetical protein [Lactococcus cremoris]WMX71742.1 hypothetical protein RF668_05675 [Lactococcus cremoris]